MTPTPASRAWHRAAAAVALLLAALGGAGATCGGSRPAVALQPPAAPQSWERALEDWTRQDRDYDWMDLRLDARATYHAPALRKAFIDHRSRFFGDFADRAKQELVDLGGGEAEHWHSFFVSTFVDWQRYKAMAHAHTIWTLSLENDQGVRVVASKIRDVRVNPAVQALYPYVDRFDRAYLVRFPLADAEGRPVLTSTTRRFTLRVDSAYARGTMVWDLVPSNEPTSFGLPRDGGPPDASPGGAEGLFNLGNILGQ